MEIKFYKMQGCGNDFLLLDYVRHGDPPVFYPREIRWLCDRHFGLGADGVVVLERSLTAHCKWTFYNADGSAAEMCGNAARCAIRFLSDRHFPNEAPISIETKAGLIRGKKIEGPEGLIEITLCPAPMQRFEYEHKVLALGDYSVEVNFINTGVPHAVIEVKDMATYPILKVGHDVRHHPAFAPAGTNVTFYQSLVGANIRATTYERGVEGETLACGTGAAAAAIVFSESYLQAFPIDVAVPGGDLSVDMSPVSQMLLLRGQANYVYDVTLPDIPNGFERRFPFSQKKMGSE